jgi:hypothetical protein
MCDYFLDEFASHRHNSAAATFINILISEFLQKEPRVRKRSEAKSHEFASLLRTIFANLIISKDEPVIISLMTGGEFHKNKIFVNCIKELEPDPKGCCARAGCVILGFRGIGG